MENNRILLVEDDQDDIELVLIALKLKRIVNPVDIVNNGQEALDYLFCKEKYKNKKEGEFPCFILLDIQLPQLTGFEVLKKLRANKRTKHIPVIMLTSSNAQKDIIDSHKYGANSFIRKPIDREKLGITIENLNLNMLIICGITDNIDKQ